MFSFLSQSTSMRVVGFVERDLSETNKVFFAPSQKIPEYIQFSDSGLIYKTGISMQMEKSTIALNKKQREINKKNEGDIISFVPYVDTIPVINSISIKISTTNKVILDCEQLTTHIKNKLECQPLAYNQQFVTSFNKIAIVYTVEQIETTDGNEDLIGLFTPDTRCVFTAEKPYIILENQRVENNLFKEKIDLKKFGVGGLSKEFEIMFRRAFVSRIRPDIAKKMGIKHVKGILLYGPPGCGKTTLARVLGKILNCEEPIIVSGPELLAGLVGQSEENVRNLFANAIADTSGTKLHLIICDEFDSLVKKRGSTRDGTGVSDNIVNQFLSMIDGPKQLDNVLLICMTNRKDLLDEAILRPGRIELHIEVQLPDQQGREEILTIHTNESLKNKLLHPDVNIHTLATLTKNYTGAELEGLVRSAAQFALVRETNPNDQTNLTTVNNDFNQMITMNDFTQSLNELIPMFGKISNDIQIITSKPFIIWTQILEDCMNDMKLRILNLTSGNISTMLVWGSTFVGKTKLVSHVAKDSGISCVKIITAEKLLRCAGSKSGYIVDIFDQCLKAETSILIIDGIERIIEWQNIGPRFNNEILQTLTSLMSSQINSNKKITLLFTANSKYVLENLGMFDLFDITYEYPTSITYDGIELYFPQVVEKIKYDSDNLENMDISQVFKNMKYIK